MPETDSLGSCECVWLTISCVGTTLLTWRSIRKKLVVCAQSSTIAPGNSEFTLICRLWCHLPVQRSYIGSRRSHVGVTWSCPFRRVDDRFSVNVWNDLRSRNRATTWTVPPSPTNRERKPFSGAVHRVPLFPTVLLELFIRLQIFPIRSFACFRPMPLSVARSLMT